MKNANNKTKKEKRGLYISLALCLIAITLAAWGTYDSLSGFIDENDPSLGGDKDVNITITTPSPSPITSPVPSPSAEASPSPDGDDPEDVNTEVIEETPKPEAVQPPVDNSASINETFMYPVSSKEIIAEYSASELVYNETMKDYRAHKGIDLKANLGDSVFACNNGEVTAVYKDLLLGNVVVIKHGEYDFFYCGLEDNILVEKGDTVSNANPIGTIGVIPSEAHSQHLHLQIKKGVEYVDPSDLVFE